MIGWLVGWFTILGIKHLKAVSKFVSPFSIFLG